MKNIVVIMFAAAAVVGMIFVIEGCVDKTAYMSEEADNEVGVIMEESVVSLEDATTTLYSVQMNFANGTAPLMEVPYILVEEVYNNFDILQAVEMKEAPASVREDTKEQKVHLFYDTGCTITWDKNDNNVFLKMQ